ncbi:MAG: hypothetical protein J5629_07600 [Muribaculaceae bacterium]|nr:hypothetical protein [Muribaculaceae bacterium]
MGKKKLLYIHGFRSSAKSSTILTIKANYHEVEVHAFDVTHHPVESIKKIEGYIAEHGIDILAGTSLGGYYALCAKVDIPKIAVNPVLNPENSLSFLPEIGQEVEYYNPREDGVQTFKCTLADLDEFRGIEKYITPVTHIIGSDKDELLGDLRDQYKALVGDRFHESSQLGHRITPEFTAIPTGDFYKVLSMFL